MCCQILPLKETLSEARKSYELPAQSNTEKSEDHQGDYHFARDFFSLFGVIRACLAKECNDNTPGHVKCCQESDKYPNDKEWHLMFVSLHQNGVFTEKATE